MQENGSSIDANLADKSQRDDIVPGVRIGNLLQMGKNLVFA
jgi:hypothetical protein